MCQEKRRILEDTDFSFNRKQKKKNKIYQKSDDELQFVVTFERKWCKRIFEFFHSFSEFLLEKPEKYPLQSRIFYV